MKADEILEHVLNANMLCMPYDVYSELFEAIDVLDQEYSTEVEQLRDLVRCMWGWLTSRTVSGAALHDISGRMHELGVDADG